jgi:putative SOS response-associated peptidase YedK
MMNIIQKVIIIIASSIVAYIILYPPWIQTFQMKEFQNSRSSNIRTKQHFRSSTSKERIILHGVEIDKDRLLAEVFLILL